MSDFEEQAVKERTKRTFWIAVIIIGVCALILAGLAAALLGGAKEDNEDIAAREACDGLVELVENLNVMNDAELRVAVQEVYGDAQDSSNEDISRSARHMLEALTRGDTTDFRDEAADMARACSEEF